MTDLIKAAVFDMDGIIVNSIPAWMRSQLNAFRRVGVNLSAEDCRLTEGLRVNETVEFWYARNQWRNYSCWEVEQWIIEGVAEELYANGQMLPGVLAAMEFFKSKEIPLALASSSYHKIIDVVLDRFALRSYFGAVCSAEDELHGKPDPAIYMTAARALGVPTSSCVAFEDSIHGINAAKRAGFRCIAVVQDIHLDLADFTEADAIIASLCELNDDLWRDLCFKWFVGEGAESEEMMA